MAHPFDAVSLESLRERESAKWRHYPPDVLPVWVAEMDYPIAEPIRAALVAAIDRNDLGYPDKGRLGASFARWADARWGWSFDPKDVHLVSDVVTAIGELIRAATAPGDGIVVDPPVYPPFAGSIRNLGRTVVTAPLLQDDAGWSMNLAAIEAAYRAGAKMHLLCSPHNPVGLVYPQVDLARLADLADRYEVLVIADEIHAPLTMPGARHVPFPLLSAAARRRTIVVTSASKSWNLAGLKAAIMIGDGDAPRAALGRLPADTPYHAGHLGVLASIAAFDHGDAWLAQTVAILDRNRMLLRELLAKALPAVRYVPPSASYLAWLDLRAIDGSDDPATRILERGRLALSSGPSFGVEGKGWARLNFGTTRALLEDAVFRLKKAY